ncbi:hypothetical protein BLNAU_18015 [Blattamonas nauphoetae]|uniref:Uncharacterized protein n=1 Tax=Blattamonas nauphoetae TaxID=2049346 RepID=A0ABQ9X5Z7_9EUKA|nr:hypothetical protein BLNAU_18015 [Blattamonas nauphoetae]
MRSEHRTPVQQTGSNLNVVLALKLGLSLERLSSTAVMQMKILKEQNLDHLEIVGREEQRLHVVRVGGVTGNGKKVVIE